MENELDAKPYPDHATAHTPGQNVGRDGTESVPWCTREKNHREPKNHPTMVTLSTHQKQSPPNETVFRRCLQAESTARYISDYRMHGPTIA